MPYQAPSGYSQPRLRGVAPMRVLHDHSGIGDTEYFAKKCGALLTVAGSDLTFTPGGGEAPLVIPAADIAEIALNASVGKSIGAFHISTTKGLYLQLAAEAADPGAGERIVSSLRKELKIGG
jgi:hypothetical protein